jgi:choline dehydrogenase-like flavoprotein
VEADGSERSSLYKLSSMMQGAARSAHQFRERLRRGDDDAQWWVRAHGYNPPQLARLGLKDFCEALATALCAIENHQERAIRTYCVFGKDGGAVLHMLGSCKMGVLVA